MKEVVVVVLSTFAVVDLPRSTKLFCTCFSQLSNKNSHFSQQSTVLSSSSVGLCVKVRARDSKLVYAALSASWNYVCSANVTRTRLLFSVFYCERIICF